MDRNPGRPGRVVPVLGVPPGTLALTLCNDGGVCDHDWNDFRIDAGPVELPSSTGCVHWRVSARDIADSAWVVQDETGRLCTSER